MHDRIVGHTVKNFFTLFVPVVVIIAITSCHITKHVNDGQYLLRKNIIVLNADKSITNKGEIRDNLSRLVLQKTNTYQFLDVIPGIPFKIWWYNRHYEKHKDDSVVPKSMERPVIFDSALMSRSMQNMKNYLFNSGYFYNKVRDTVTLANKKAYVSYRISTGGNYLINKVNYDADDSNMAKIVKDAYKGSGLQKDKTFSFSMIDDERSYITSVLRNNGYYKFSQENVTFSIDTLNKAYFKNIESPLESAIGFISAQKTNKKPTLDITVMIRPTEDTMAYDIYSIGKVSVYPDFQSSSDLQDTTMIHKTLHNVIFKYHNHYINASVLLSRIYLMQGKEYSQSDYDKTIAKLTDLGVFQYIKVEFHENPDNRHILDCDIKLNANKKHDISLDYQLSSGSTYSLGNSLNLNYIDKNLARGANQLKIGLSGGIEDVYNANYGKSFLNHFFVLTRYYGVNASIDFPKFLSPIGAGLFDNSNLPHTIISGGANVMDRISYFTLINTTLNYSYTWHQTTSKIWSFSPAFINIIRLPTETDSFKARLDTNQFLRNSYKQNFIEGENISFTYSDYEKKKGSNYSYLKLSFEEAGALMSGINKLETGLNGGSNIQFAQYTKFDFDGRHYFTNPYSTFAFRFYGGIGLPYGQSDALPYIKQYFAGGPYSLRGWRIRILGPGSYYNPNSATNINTIDNTGDIKLETNGEFRFPLFPMFAGSIKVNGALFADAGNIWLAKKDTSYVGGNFTFNTLGQDIAMDVGAGLRFDIVSFLTFRLDVAIPVKKPYVLTNSGWVFNDIDFSNPTWRTNNIILNISIGYPF